MRKRARYVRSCVRAVWSAAGVRLGVCVARIVSIKSESNEMGRHVNMRGRKH